MSIYVSEVYLLASRDHSQENLTIMSGYPVYKSSTTAVDAMEQVNGFGFETIYVLKVKGTEISEYVSRVIPCSTDLHQILVAYCASNYIACGQYPDEITFIIEDERLTYQKEQYMQALSESDKYNIEHQAV